MIEREARKGKQVDNCIESFYALANGVGVGVGE